MSQAGAILYGSTSIPFQVQFSRRKTLEIAVQPTGEVEVTAPVGTEMQQIESKVKRRASWILRQRGFFDQFLPRTPPRQFLSGETHLYLGRRYRLKAVAGAVDRLRLMRGLLSIESSREPSVEAVEAILQGWYRGRAEAIFKDLFKGLLQRFGLQVSAPRLQIKKMRTRWGSLSKGGILTLNPELIRAPKECIEYVLCHELCHLDFHDHSAGFYQLLAQRLPDWEERKRKLESIMA
jgi:predicted metal-dependent hydrolase